MGLARQALDAYLLKLNTYPLRMQLITGTMIGYAGDAIAQVGFQIDTPPVHTISDLQRNLVPESYAERKDWLSVPGASI